MFSNFRFFEKQYEKYLRIDYLIDVRSSPSNLIYSIKNIGPQKQLLKAMTKKTQNGFKIMRRLTIAHLLLIYSNSFYDMIEQFVQCPIDSSDQWLNQQCIRTYYYFLKKIVASRQLFLRVKDYCQKQVGFQTMFYIINLMNEMFKIVNKMPLLGRYFKDTNEIITSSFIQTIAIQAQKLYTFFKNALQQILTNPRTYIANRQDEKLVKAILEESLTNLNQQMKKLFLDKYFYPYGKGIGIRLFRTQEQPEYTLKIIKGIVSEHKDTQRNLAQADLQKTIFPEEGQVNIQFFQRTLKPTQQKYEQVIIKDLQQIEEQQINPTHFDETSVQIDKFQKQTSHHMQICEDV